MDADVLTRPPPNEVSLTPRSTFAADLLVGLRHLRPHAVKFAGGRSGADDLVQETALRAWDARESFTVGTNLNAWLYTIMRNSYLTSRKKTRLEVADVDGEYAAKAVSRPAQVGHVMWLEVSATLARLSLEQQAAIRLVFIEGTMKSRANRGREKLKWFLRRRFTEVTVR